MEPEAGFEPATYALRVRCSTPELPRHGEELYKSPATGVRYQVSRRCILSSCDPSSTVYSKYM
jgi:hypothetical protein